MSTARFNKWENSDGTENFKVRAWVNFNGTGTVAIRSAGNVSSITDNAAGDYTVNFATPMPDANYGVSATTDNSGASAFRAFLRTSVAVPTVSAVRVGSVDASNVLADATYFHIIAVR